MSGDLAPSVAQPKGKPDFVEPNETVTGWDEKVAADGEPDFDKASNKTVKGEGDKTPKQAYTTEKQAQRTGDSHF
jgi:hypothetical protein